MQVMRLVGLLIAKDWRDGAKQARHGGRSDIGLSLLLRSILIRALAIDGGDHLASFIPQQLTALATLIRC
jgi:hypothetical protein